MKKRIVLAMLVASAVAQAAEWQVVSLDATVNSAIEKTMLKRHGSHVLVWERRDYAKLQFTRQGDAYDEALMREDIDCANDTMKFLSMKMTAGGKEVSSVDQETPTMQIQPDSLAYSVERAVCTP
ncbi:surface-adhesin E family protein [Paraburkholderia bryophila]|uniref:Surface-adhesin protein E-like domain-containing protein n=1 Tax=Paraburkholderia bryophila TaxID=420952 RepID=A0A7Y9W4F5_9BURK|nr:surface-adhesin E family protein [Paraburkholderia bryophila]NYH13543.1 hypothetical protein [Paraburkholderia bryophila]